MTIKFKSEVKTLEINSAEGKPIHYPIEYRWDPLTSRLVVVCPHLKEKWSLAYKTNDGTWLKSLIEDSRQRCPFCRPQIDKITAKFLPSQLDREILKFDDVYVFPNLFPRTDFEAVITSPEAHDLSRFNADEHSGYLNAAVECIKMAVRKNPALRYPAIGCNYLTPAGASQTHFHIQLSIQQFCYSHIRTMLDCSRNYQAEHGENYWTSLIAGNGQREIKRSGNVYWHTPFAPQGFSEVQAIISGAGIANFTREDTEELADGLSRVLEFYRHRGYLSFNYAICSAETDEMPSLLQIVARPNPSPNYISLDSWYMPLLMGQQIVLEKPEGLAKELRSYF